MVQFDDPRNRIKLQQADSRSLRLETLGSRLFTYLEQNRGEMTYTFFVCYTKWWTIML